MELISENRAFGGRHLRYEHEASTTQCKMTFAVYLPPFASADKPVHHREPFQGHPDSGWLH